MPVYGITTDIGSPAAPSFYSFEEVATLSFVSGDKAILVNNITFRGLHALTLKMGQIKYKCLIYHQ